MVRMTDQEKQVFGLYGKSFEILERGGNRMVYRTRCPDGGGTMTSFQVFPGVELIYNDFSTVSCFQNVTPIEDIVEINHCRKGRFECEFREGAYVYLGEGDLAVNTLVNAAIGSSFPLGVYQGISILIYLGEAQEALSHLPFNMQIDFGALIHRLRLHETCYILRATREIQHIFDELYSVDPAIRDGYFKLKILELFLFLSTINPAVGDRRQKYFSKWQVETVKHIHGHLTEHLEEHFTLPQLADEHHIGLTTLKLCFREVYGKPVYEYLKEYRLHAAAVMLHESDDSIGYVAGKVGYANASKFSCAFRKAMGVTPLRYRKTARPFGFKNVRSE